MSQVVNIAIVSNDRPYRLGLSKLVKQNFSCIIQLVDNDIVLLTNSKKFDCILIDENSFNTYLNLVAFTKDYPSIIIAEYSTKLDTNSSKIILKGQGKDKMIKRIKSVVDRERVMIDQERYTKGKINLTRRENEVLLSLCEGNSSVQIARALSLSSKTIQVYRSSLLKKFKAKNSAHLVYTALKS